MTRTRSLRLTAAALTAAAALTLTACGGNDGSGAKTSGKADTSAADGQEQGQPADDSGQADTAQAATASKDGKNGAKGTCTAANVKVEAKAVQTPVNHLLIVATNTSKSPCHAYNFPFIRFDADQATAGAVEESRPQGVITLAPGKAAYAGVITSAADGSGGAGRDAKKLGVSFQGSDGNGSVGDQASVDLPGGKVHVDDSARVTYWQSGSPAALKW
ncbi:DUF4232 domain-containing protein [Streptomyces sp. NPDC020379]|uniref:DUF4232 domain-containing protein n=1 Tax=Streptomyces sp. NPDC020379 TaxID=3365071 RepID=UPI00378EF66B